MLHASQHLKCPGVGSIALFCILITQSMCVCVCVCVCACVRACVRVCVCVSVRHYVCIGLLFNCQHFTTRVLLTRLLNQFVEYLIPFPANVSYCSPQDPYLSISSTYIFMHLSQMSLPNVILVTKPLSV